MAINPEELNTRFTYHPPKGNQAQVYEEIRAHARDFAEFLSGHVVHSRELSLAITHVEEAVFWANAGVARRS